jgi:hypothetical protein
LHGDFKIKNLNKIKLKFHILRVDQIHVWILVKSWSIAPGTSTEQKERTHTRILYFQHVLTLMLVIAV